MLVLNGTAARREQVAAAVEPRGAKAIVRADADAADCPGVDVIVDLGVGPGPGAVAPGVWRQPMTHDTAGVA